MQKNTVTIIIITFNAIFLACGILMIFIPSVIFNNYWALLSILVFSTSLLFPVLCGALKFKRENLDSYLFDEPSDQDLGAMLAWFLWGVFISIGYAIPFELWRTNLMNAIGMGTTMGGGTVILISILVFIYFGSL
jgi:hypothetical protein